MDTEGCSFEPLKLMSKGRCKGILRQCCVHIRTGIDFRFTGHGVLLNRRETGRQYERYGADRGRGEERQDDWHTGRRRSWDRRDDRGRGGHQRGRGGRERSRDRLRDYEHENRFRALSQEHSPNRDRGAEGGR